MLFCFVVLVFFLCYFVSLLFIIPPAIVESYQSLLRYANLCKEKSSSRQVKNNHSEKISAFVDHQLKSLVPKSPSYFKDTNDLLAKHKDMERFLHGAILVNIDLVGLYHNIPHDEGLEALRRTLNKGSNPAILSDHTVDMTEFVLKNKNFEFDGKHFFYKNVVQPLIQGWRLHMLIYFCTT